MNLVKYKFCKIAHFYWMQWPQELSNILFVWFQRYFCYKKSDSTRLRGIWNLEGAEILQLLDLIQF